MVLLDRERIKEILPHREPFLLIDEIIALEPGKKCVARTHLKESDPWVEGHFPGYHVTPGVLLLEMLAQAGAVCVGVLPEARGKLALLAKIDKAKFRRQVFPGETLTLEIEMVKMKAAVGVGRAYAHVEGQSAVTAELTFSFADPKDG